jgi:hypothetical protein
VAARKASETFAGLGWVTKIIAVISCGPAIIVTASGRIAGAHLADPNHRTEVVVAGVNSAAARQLVRLRNLTTSSTGPLEIRVPTWGTE